MKSVRWWRLRLLRVLRTSPVSGEPEEEWSWRKFGRKVVHVLPFVLITMMGVAWMEAAGWFRGFETSHLDTMIRMQKPDLSQNIVVVEISEEDYQEIFEATSPLDKFKLLDLIQAVQKYNPRVIGVDIDTNDWGAPCKRNNGDASCARKCAQLTKQLDELRKAERPLPGAEKLRSAIVWAAVPRSLEPPLAVNPGLRVLPLNCDRPGTQPCDRLGMPRFPIDEDGSVRHFERRVEVAKVEDACPTGARQDGEKCYMPTFAQAILEEYTGADKPDSDERVIFNFHGDRYQFQTIDSRQFFPEEKVKNETRTSKEISNESEEIDESRAALLNGKIVLIGGGFPEARDAYFTPMGPMEGVKLNALAIQTDLSKGGITDVSEIGEWFVDLGISIFLVFVFYRYENRPLTALWISASVIPIAFVSSVILFNTATYWFNFIPVAAGVIIHQLSDFAEGGAKAQQELKRLKNEQGQMEVDVVTIEKIGIAESAESGAIDESPVAEDPKVKRAAGGAS